MSYYFNQSLTNKMRAMVGVTKPSAVVHVDAARLAKQILSKITEDDIVILDEVMYIGACQSTSSKIRYDAKMLGRVEQEIRGELRAMLGIDANVAFTYGGEIEEDDEEEEFVCCRNKKQILYNYGLSISVPLY